MSFWGATVISNFFSVIPYLGRRVVMWLWGGFAVDSPTLTRFYSFHFIFPFVLLFLLLLHLVFLHERGSSKPLGIFSKLDKIRFSPFFILIDLGGALFLFFLTFFFFFLFFERFFEVQNFLEANSLETPRHIQPE
jgi:ubiquinol-cytochrome c reductase cytochrome b subunit